MALIPILGSHIHPHPQVGDTIYPVGSKLGPVQKCTICGYSVSMQSYRIQGVDDAAAATVHITLTQPGREIPGETSITP